MNVRNPTSRRAGLLELPELSTGALIFSIIFIIVVFGLFIACIVYLFRTLVFRSLRLKKIVIANGASFTKRRDYDASLDSFTLLKDNRGLYFKNLVTKKIIDLEVEAFDYVFLRWTQSFIPQFIFVYRVTWRTAVPVFSIFPSSLLYRPSFMNLLSHQKGFSLSIPGHQAFAKKYLVNGNERELRSFFNKEFIVQLERMNPDFYLESDGRSIILFRNSGRKKIFGRGVTKPEGVLLRMQELATLVGLLEQRK